MPRSTLAQMALSSKYYALQEQRLETILGQKSGSKSSRMAKLWLFLQGHPKPVFSVKVQKEDQGKFFKNRQKKSPRLKGPKANWRKWHYPLIYTRLKCKHWTTFWRKQRLQKCPNGQVMAVFTRSFKKSKGETKRNFKKITQKVPLASKGQEHSGENLIIL